VGSSTWPPLAVALIAAAAMMLTAALTQRATSLRERAGRRAEHESARLDELFAVALDLRELMFTVAATLTAGPEGAVRYERLDRTLLAHRHAIRALRVGALAGEWARLAGLALSEDPEADPAAEEAIWEEFLVALGTARRDCV
jgi:hypothetical protein